MLPNDQLLFLRTIVILPFGSKSTCNKNQYLMNFLQNFELKQILTKEFKIYYQVVLYIIFLQKFFEKEENPVSELKDHRSSNKSTLVID